MQRAPSSIGAIVVGLVAFAGCAPESHPEPATHTLRVMTFNVEYGGTGVDFDKVVEAVRAADADVVGLEEPYGNARRLADALGWPYASRRSDVISRHPLIDPPGAGAHQVWVELEPGRVLAVANVHLPSDPYGPYFTTRCPASAILQLERELRLPAIQPLLDELVPLIDAGVPALLMGDFNAPSHRDWTEATTGTRPQLSYPLAWPVSLAVEAAGFVDTYRTAHPDARAEPGLTWWAARPNIEADFPGTDPQDRIDLLYAAGVARVRSSEIVGEAGADVDLEVTPWPSDHRAVVSELEVVPALAPSFISPSERRITLGEPIELRFHSQGAPAASVQLVARSAATNAEAATDSEAAAAPEVALAMPVAPEASGVLQLDSAGLTAGAYELRLLDATSRPLASAPLWLAEPGSPARIATSAPEYAPGEPIGIRWENAPGNRWDWVSVYRAPADPASDDYLVWRYLKAEVDGSLLLDASAEGSSWPLEPGDYEALLLLYDAYDVAARTPFRVSGEPLPGAPESGSASAPAWDAACSPAAVTP